MFRSILKPVSLALAVALMLSASAVCYAGDIDGSTSSDGAVITVVLFATVITVLVLIGIKADYENVFGKKQEIQPKVSEEEFMSRISVVLERQEFQRGIEGIGADGGTDVASDVSLGLRMRF